MRYSMIDQSNGTYKLDVRLEIPLPATDTFSLYIQRQEKIGDEAIVRQNIPLVFSRDVIEYGIHYSKMFEAYNIIIEPLPHLLQIYLVVNGVLGGQVQGQSLSFAASQDLQLFFPNSGFTQAEFNASVAANVAASLQAQVVPLQNQITTLNAQILALQQANAGNLQPLINAGLILQPERRVGTYTIKDFTVLNAIYRAGAPTYFIKKDLDFINVQLLSIRQAEITRVIDGDTYVATVNQREYTIRIVGADTFETRLGRKLLAQARSHNIPLRIALQKGQAAKHFAENVLLGETVTLTRPDDSPDNDGYFRYLRTVQIVWGNALTDFAGLLVQRGHGA